ncbi:Ethanolamine sensory transduction histidine kinase [Furfurilactobacillus rossiae]|nr:Ethanolamine sensory transduction histidine kinase [Furfurilactobacillus rossiae]
MNEIEKLCQRYTTLDSLDVKLLVETAEKISQTESYQDFDVFIDVRNEFSDQAVVVFHKPPLTKQSLYHRQVVGQQALRTNEPGVMPTLETQLKSVDLLAETQEQRLIHQRIYPIIRGNRTLGATIIESDESENVLNDFQSPKDGQSRFNDISATVKMFNRQESTTITDQLADAILVFDHSGTLVLANQTAINLYQKVGYIGKIIGLDFENLSLDGTRFQENLKVLSQVDERDQPLKSTFNYLNYFFSSRKFWNRESRQLVVLLEDKTDVKAKEAEIISKSVAIREINHRVKNNLQSVISLLRIQQRRLDDETAKQALTESISRITAIASTYELMSKQIEDETNLKAALQLLVSHFIQLDDNTQQITIDLQVDETITVNSDQVVTISIIVNELLQNAFAHAFTASTPQNHVLIQGTVSNNVITLQVKDNGIGFDPHRTRSGSLGLMIIRSYVSDKLSGKLNIETSSVGTDVTFSFDHTPQQ